MGRPPPKILGRPSPIPPKSQLMVMTNNALPSNQNDVTQLSVSKSVNLEGYNSQDYNENIIFIVVSASWPAAVYAAYSRPTYIMYM